jgi:carbamoyltransferase
MMYILGISAYHADSSAVLIRDGELIVAVEEERFRRIKHWAGFPSRSIEACLEVAGIAGSEVSHVAVSRNPRAHLFRKAVFALRNRMSFANIAGRTRALRQVQDIRAPLAAALRAGVSFTPKIHFVEHHPAHLASTFFISPFDDAAVCAIDGFGDNVSTSTGIGRNNKVELHTRVMYPHSLGILYTAITQYLGFAEYGAEFKVMGLAAYGAPSLMNEMRNLVSLGSNGTFQLNRKYFRHWKEGIALEWEGGVPSMGRLYASELEGLLGPTRLGDEPITIHHENIARTLQDLYEECLFHVLDALWVRTRNPRLALAGGCALNCVANGRIREATHFEEVYIPPAAGDNGTALGAAFHVWNNVLGKSRSFVMEHAYWGPEHQTPDLAALLERHGDSRWRFDLVQFDDDEALCRKTAELISDGNVVGWYQGRMEWGARALGNRSILADPRRPDVREVINSRIKFREKFRPFAPSITEAAVEEYFVNAANDPFMQQVYPVRPEKRAIVPAITHADGTSRIQTVSKRKNPRYFRLLTEFEKITGVPVLLNTSFNENEPIVDTPEQALDCFLRTQMDVIVINNSMVRRHLVGEDGTNV